MIHPNQDELILTQFEEALNQAALSSSTIVNYLADLRAFLRWGQRRLTGGFSLQYVTPEHIRLYREYLVEELKRATSTTNRHLMSLRKFFSFAEEIRFVTLDPAVGVSLVTETDRTKGRTLSEKEAHNLINAAQNGSRAGLIRRDAAILKLLLYTGLRVSEIVDLQKQDLVFDDPGVHLRVGTHQDRSQARQLPLPGEVCRALNDYLQVRPRTSTTDCFFLSQEGRPISSRTVQRIISDCARSVGLKGISAQTLRRTFAMNLLAKTGDVALVSKRLGHQSQSITEQYLAVCEHQ
ncbi:MAG: tyrosine-type recombinase/integrase [Anaerolineae bacterium]|nr:tyrosine-type recombinase/integrase [Anaerolineae bacterium]